jgi:hypothetical protein
MVDRGKLAEIDFIRLCLREGWDVYTPVTAAGPVDVIFGTGSRLQRAQVKRGYVQDSDPGIVRVDLRRSTPDRAAYAPDTIDVLVVVYDDYFWIIPWAEVGDRFLSIPLASADSKYEAWRRKA